MPSLHYPAPEQLQTGDLLFPKVAAAAAFQTTWLTIRKRFVLPDTDPEMNRTLSAYLGEEVVKALHNDAFHHDVSALLARPRVPSSSSSGQDPGLSEFGLELSQLGAEQARLSTGSFGLGLKLSALGFEISRLAEEKSQPRAKADRTMLMLVILIKAFPDLLVAWLNMTVKEFLAHPLCELLMGAIERESGPGFFVGHVAMVLRERNGAHHPDGQVWVIEANTTGFSHYRVAVHRYLVEGEPLAIPKPTDPVSPRLRGWANRRLAMGESVWCSRHRTLDVDDAQALTLRQRLVHVSKSYLGRPYGFFDEPAFGDSGRFYCGEYVHRVLQDVGQASLRVDENRTWDWLYANRALLGDAAFAKRVEHALQSQGLLKKMLGKPFFLLTLPMLYCSSTLLSKDASGVPPYL